MARQQTILKEDLSIKCDISPQDLQAYAEQLGIDYKSEPHLLWIAREGLEAPVPAPWCPVEDGEGRIYYFNQETRLSSWDHPADSYYRKLVNLEKQRHKSLANAPSGSAPQASTHTAVPEESELSSLDVPPLSISTKKQEESQVTFQTSLSNDSSSKNNPSDHKSASILTKMNAMHLVEPEPDNIKPGSEAENAIHPFPSKAIKRNDALTNNEALASSLNDEPLEIQEPEFIKAVLAPSNVKNVKFDLEEEEEEEESIIEDNIHFSSEESEAELSEGLFAFKSNVLMDATLLGLSRPSKSSLKAMDPLLHISGQRLSPPSEPLVLESENVMSPIKPKQETYDTDRNSKESNSQKKLEKMSTLSDFSFSENKAKERSLSKSLESLPFKGEKAYMNQEEKIIEKDEKTKEETSNNETNGKIPGEESHISLEKQIIKKEFSENLKHQTISNSNKEKMKKDIEDSQLEELERMKEKFKAENKAELEKMINNLQVLHNEQLEETKEKLQMEHKKELEEIKRKMQEEQQKELEEIKRKMQGEQQKELEEIKRKMQEEQQKEREDLKDKLHVEQQKKLEETKMKMQAKFDQEKEEEKEKLLAHHDRHINEMKRNLESEYKNKMKEVEETLEAELNEDLDRLKQDFKKRHSVEKEEYLQNLIFQYDQEKENLKEGLEKDLEQKRKEISEKKKQASFKLEEDFKNWNLNLEHEMEEKKAKILITPEFQELQNDLLNMQREKLEEGKSLESLKGQIEELENEKIHLESYLKELKTTIREEEQKLQNIKVKKTSLSEQVEKLNEELASGKKSLLLLQDEIQVLQEDYVQLEKQVKAVNDSKTGHHQNRDMDSLDNSLLESSKFHYDINTRKNDSSPHLDKSSRTNNKNIRLINDKQKSSGFDLIMEKIESLEKQFLALESRLNTPLPNREQEKEETKEKMEYLPRKLPYAPTICPYHFSDDNGNIQEELHLYKQKLVDLQAHHQQLAAKIPLGPAAYYRGEPAWHFPSHPLMTQPSMPYKPLWQHLLDSPFRTVSLPSLNGMNTKPDVSQTSAFEKKIDQHSSQIPLKGFSTQYSSSNYEGVLGTSHDNTLEEWQQQMSTLHHRIQEHHNFLRAHSPYHSTPLS